VSRPRPRRTRIATHLVQADARWSDSTLLFRQWDGKGWQEVIITISNPSELRYVRGRLNEIEQGWRKQLGVTP
jgi:hypothetical protein